MGILKKLQIYGNPSNIFGNPEKNLANLWESLENLWESWKKQLSDDAILALGVGGDAKLEPSPKSGDSISHF